MCSTNLYVLQFYKLIHGIGRSAPCLSEAAVAPLATALQDQVNVENPRNARVLCCLWGRGKIGRGTMSSG